MAPQPSRLPATLRSTAPPAPEAAAPETVMYRPQGIGVERVGDSFMLSLVISNTKLVLVEIPIEAKNLLIEALTGGISLVAADGSAL